MQSFRLYGAENVTDAGAVERDYLPPGPYNESHEPRGGSRSTPRTAEDTVHLGKATFASGEFWWCGRGETVPLPPPRQVQGLGAADLNAVEERRVSAPPPPIFHQNALPGSWLPFGRLWLGGHFRYRCRARGSGKGGGRGIGSRVPHGVATLTLPSLRHSLPIHLSFWRARAYYDDRRPHDGLSTGTGIWSCRKSSYRRAGSSGSCCHDPSRRIT